uniref:TIL domain-containing protein n=1 Tax=Heterorhabditis bacteriophora TaxID=37862 RepID=A0A1I7WGN1_HETBA
MYKRISSGLRKGKRIRNHTFSASTYSSACTRTILECIEGYHQECINGNPECVPNPTCGPNEIFLVCSSCEPTCGPIVPCLDICFPPACQCINGYVRNNGKCIRRDKCPMIPCNPIPYPENAS